MRCSRAPTCWAGKEQYDGWQLQYLSPRSDNKLADPFIWTSGSGDTGHAQVEIGGGEKALGASKNKGVERRIRMEKEKRWMKEPGYKWGERVIHIAIKHAEVRAHDLSFLSLLPPAREDKDDNNNINSGHR